MLTIYVFKMFQTVSERAVGSLWVYSLELALDRSRHTANLQPILIYIFLALGSDLPNTILPFVFLVRDHLQLTSTASAA